MRKSKQQSGRAFLQGSAAALAGIGSASLAGCGAGAASTDDGLPGTPSEDGDSRQAAPAVYITREISASALVKAYQALGFSPQGKVAVKLSTGETGSNYLRPELVAGLVHALDAAIVECNTAYGGERSSTESHRQLAAKDDGDVIA